MAAVTRVDALPPADFAELEAAFAIPLEQGGSQVSLMLTHAWVPTMNVTLLGRPKK
jgi:hypothetical protein